MRDLVHKQLFLLHMQRAHALAHSEPLEPIEEGFRSILRAAQKVGLDETQARKLLEEGKLLEEAE